MTTHCLRLWLVSFNDLALHRTCTALKKVERQRFEAVIQGGEDSTVRVTTLNGDAGPGQLESGAPWNTCVDLPLKTGFYPSEVVKPRERYLSAGLPQEWSLRVSQLLTFSSMSVRMASSFATTYRALSKLKHIGGLNLSTFLPGPSVLNKM